MATVTDLTGNQNTTDDNKSVQIGEDSNINVFEFGNLILADILPTILWLINYISDMGGSSVSASDNAGSSISESDETLGNTIAYDDSSYTYEDSRINYSGNILQGSVVDISGS